MEINRVNTGGNVYASGTTLSLTITPINGFTGSITLNADLNDTTPDIFGNTANANNAGSPNFSFYEPVHHGVVAVGNPSTVLNFSDGLPKTLILTLTLNSAAVMAAGTYNITLFANPNDTTQSNTRMGTELSLPVVVANYTPPNSGPYTGGANNGVYRAARSYYPTGGNANYTKTGQYYDALTGTLTLPPTSPDSVSIILDLNSNDAYDIYSGGVALEPIHGGNSGIDIGLTVGHTGNFGYSPTGNYGGAQRPPDTLGNDQILPGPITFTLEAPGYSDPVYGVVPEQDAYLIVQGANISPGLGQPAKPVPSQMYTFSNLPLTWIHTNLISLKYITSIAQKATGTTSYNGPPGVATPVFYTSGSKVPYMTWGNLGIHVQNPTPGFVTPPLTTFSADEASPGSNYVTSAILNTLPPSP